MRSMSIRRDLPKMMAIEKTLPAKERWPEHAFLNRPGKPIVIACVLPSQDGQAILGYAVYQMGVEAIELLRVVVAKEHRRQGHGRQILEHFKKRLTANELCNLSIWVPETKLPAHLFLKACGLRATSIAYRAGKTNQPDDYVFEYDLYSGMKAA